MTTSVVAGDVALVLADGTIEGFVGGACAEHSVRAYSLTAIESGEAVLLRILPFADPEAVPGDAIEDGAVTVENPCLSGGAIEVFLEPVLSSPRVLVVGDAMLDICVFGSVERISPEAPVPIMRQQESRESAGGAANVAANVVGMGGACHLIGCAGNDTDADHLAAALTAAGITFDLVRSDDRPTTVKTRFFAGQHQLLRLDREKSLALPPACPVSVPAAANPRFTASASGA